MHALRVPVQLSQESIFGFLTSTRLPVVSSLALLIRWVSLALAIAAATYGIGCLTFADNGFWTVELPWSGALPALVSAPVFLAAWFGWRSQRLQHAAVLLFVALFTLTIPLPHGMLF